MFLLAPLKETMAEFELESPIITSGFKSNLLHNRPSINSNQIVFLHTILGGPISTHLKEMGYDQHTKPAKLTASDRKME